MNKSNDNTIWLLILLALLAFGGTLTGVGAAPFVVPANVPVAVVVAADLSPQGRIDLDKTHHGAFAAAQQYASLKKGQFREVDINVKDLPTQDAQWAQDAAKLILASTVPPPIILAATPNGGIKITPLPTTADDTTKLLAPLVK